MTDAQWADISEFQRPVDDSYPHPILCIRSNDGSYQDRNFVANRAWCDHAVATGRLAMYLVYYFYRPGMSGLATLKNRVGVPNPKMGVMIDVESDGGRVRGDQSGNINTEHDQAATWLGDKRRVVGYGNVGDLNTLWPHKPAGLRLVVANYSHNPGYPGQFAHQYTDHGACAPFGTCDMNSADGMTVADLLAMFGLDGQEAAAFKPPAAATAPAAPAIEGDNMILVDPVTGGTWCVGSREGAIYTLGKAPYLGGTNNNGMNTARYPCVGIGLRPNNDGYRLILDWGAGKGDQSADGTGTRFRSYDFPRNGTAVAKTGTY